MDSISHPPPPARFRNGRIRPWIALRGIYGQIRNSEDTAAGARFVYALQGQATERVFQRFRNHPKGARILAERRSIRATLTDRSHLRALPKGSLGRTYVDFMDAEEISLEGLAAEIAKPVREVVGDMDEERQLVHDRITDVHDLWHVATGYSRDMAGEFALLALGYEQLGNPAYRLSLAAMRPIFAFQAPDVIALIDDARRRGREASWLPVQDWEGLLPVPLDAVRERLELGPAPAYTRYFRVGAWLRPEASLTAA